MKRIAILLLLLLVGCEVHVDEPVRVNPRPSVSEHPVANLPSPLREPNYLANEEGSCTHASLIGLLRWQGRHWMAAHWRQTYGGGEYPESLANKLDHEGVRYAYTAGRNDVAFLEWACRTRRGCGVTIQGGRHMVVLADLTDQWAALIDPNDPVVQWVPRETFLAEWQASNSWALAVLYTPSPPL